MRHTPKQIEAYKRNHAILRLRGMVSMCNLYYPLAAGGERKVLTKEEDQKLIDLVNNALQRLGVVEHLYAKH
jgi:hypothetical protein